MILRAIYIGPVLKWVGLEFRCVMRRDGLVEASRLLPYYTTERTMLQSDFNYLGHDGVLNGQPFELPEIPENINWGAKGIQTGYVDFHDGYRSPDRRDMYFITRSSMIDMEMSRRDGGYNSMRSRGSRIRVQGDIEVSGTPYGPTDDPWELAEASRRATESALEYARILEEMYLTTTDETLESDDILF